MSESYKKAEVDANTILQLKNLHTCTKSALSDHTCTLLTLSQLFYQDCVN